MSIVGLEAFVSTERTVNYKRRQNLWRKALLGLSIMSLVLFTVVFTPGLEDYVDVAYCIWAVVIVLKIISWLMYEEARNRS